MEFLTVRRSLFLIGASVVVLLLAATSKPTLADSATIMTSKHAGSGNPEAIAILPKDEAALRNLEQRHRRIVRNSTKLCSTALGSVNAGSHDPCVISGTEKGVEESGDPILMAFNEALPMSVRYDENRPENVWRIGLDDEAPDAVIIEDPYAPDHE